MPSFIRTIFPYAALTLILSTIAWSMSFGVLPRADFAFNNGDEVKTVDPAKATGSPEGRIINALFEGLLSQMPKGMQFDEEGNMIHDPIVNPDGNTPMVLVPGMAEALPEISSDGLEYTFRIRPNVPTNFNNGMNDIPTEDWSQYVQVNETVPVDEPNSVPAPEEAMEFLIFTEFEDELSDILLPDSGLEAVYVGGGIHEEL